MERKKMSLAQAEARLINKGCRFEDHAVPGSTVGKYRIVLIPEGIVFGLGCWAALDCIRHNMPATYMFETGKRARAGKHEEKS